MDFLFEFGEHFFRRFGLVLFGFVLLCVFWWCSGLVVVEVLRVGGRACLGVKVDLPGCSAPLLLVVAEKGFVMCGFLNLEVAERLGVAAAVVSGVRSFGDVLGAEVRAVTGRAVELGVRVGMKGEEALRLMF